MASFCQTPTNHFSTNVFSQRGTFQNEYEVCLDEQILDLWYFCHCIHNQVYMNELSFGWKCVTESRNNVVTVPKNKSDGHVANSSTIEIVTYRRVGYATSRWKIVQSSLTVLVRRGDTARCVHRSFGLVQGVKRLC